ncbi:MAG: hypothetical protein EOO05_21235, partial [Chitinophagaceae bacterium]
MEENRRRQFGGASAAWGGRCLPFDPIDFEKRSWVADSGWPVSFEALKAYYPKAAALCKTGSANFTVDGGKEKEILPGLKMEAFTDDTIERWSPPVNFAKTYRHELEQAQHIEVWLDSHALQLDMTEAGKIDTVTVSVLNKAKKIAARIFVLAAGGIENPRLLLASKNDFYPAGIGNQHDNVGRYYMAHLNGTYLKIAPTNRETLNMDFSRDGKVYTRRRWQLSAKKQREAGLLNSIFFLHHAEETTGHRDVVFSAVFLAKGLKSLAAQRSLAAANKTFRLLRPALKEHLLNVGKNGFRSIPLLTGLLRKRISTYRLPYILPAKNAAWLGLYFQAEQTPNRESRLTISADEKDALGMPRVIAGIQFNKQDLEAVVATHNLFADAYTQAGIGALDYTEAGLRAYLDKQITAFNSSAHHIGTTRMSAHPENGVVDSDAKVFGLSNLYVAGSSVFPTGSHANPTLTIVAQALRLAVLRSFIFMHTQQFNVQTSIFDFQDRKCPTCVRQVSSYDRVVL